jgi:hypothetical protein
MKPTIYLRQDTEANNISRDWERKAVFYLGSEDIYTGDRKSSINLGEKVNKKSRKGQQCIWDIGIHLGQEAKQHIWIKPTTYLREETDNITGTGGQQTWDRGHINLRTETNNIPGTGDQQHTWDMNPTT